MNKLMIVVALCLGLSGTAARADSIPLLVIKDHKITPATMEVKAGERFKLSIRNDDATSEEFESKTMIIEKFIAPGKTITVNLGPLKPGVYEFFGDFHPSTAKGELTAK